MRPNGRHYSPSEPRVSGGPPAADGSRGSARVHRSQSWRACAATRWGRTGPAGSRWFHFGPAPHTQRRHDQDGPRPDGVHADLVRQGFPEFAQRALAALDQNAPLFFKPTQEPSRNPAYRGPAVKARERLAAWVREQGVTDPGISDKPEPCMATPVQDSRPSCRN
jgi:hypothetical protein